MAMIMFVCYIMILCFINMSTTTNAELKYAVDDKDRERANEAFLQYNTGLQQARSGHVQEAITSYSQAVHLYPEIAHAHNNLASLLSQVDHDDTTAWYHYEQAVFFAHQRGDNETLVSAYNNMGFLVRQRCGKNVLEMKRALTYFDQALNIFPEDTQTLFNTASAFVAMGESNLAVPYLIRILQNTPYHTAANMDMGNIHFRRGEWEEALAYTDVIVKNSKELHEVISALNNKGQYLRHVGYVQEALQAHEEAVQLDTSRASSLVNVLNARRTLCHWEDLDELHERIEVMVQDALLLHGDHMALQPYDAMLMPRSSAWLTSIAKVVASPWEVMDALYDPTMLPLDGKKILKIAYLSFDFRDHPMGHLTLGAISNHDRDNVYVYSFSYGTNDNSTWRKQHEEQSDVFLDVQAKSALEIASIIVELKVDIVIDLMGHTTGTRMGIIASHPSPIVVNYLGYPGTTGGSFTDYIIADATVAPAEDISAGIYTEKVVYLPYIYQVNAYDISLPTKTMLNNDENENDFLIFGNLNTINKLEPMVFKLWMSILRRVPRSVLWLLEPRPNVARVVVPTFRFEAAAVGIDPARLVFVPRLPKKEHLTRLLQVDIFLDTIIYNAHTTAADALYMHVPIVTCSAGTFASRVATSLLHGVGCGFLSTYSLKEYENVAVQVAKSATLRLEIHQKLVKGALQGPLFQTWRTTAALERGYQSMWEVIYEHRRDDGLMNSLSYKHIVLIDAPLEPLDNERIIERWTNQALELHTQGQLEDAAIGYRRILEAFPQACNALHLLGLILYQTLRYEEARGFILQAIQLQPRVALYQSNLAEVYLSLGDDNEAELCFRKVLELEINNSQAYLKLSHFLEKREKYSELVNLFMTHAALILSSADPVIVESMYLQHTLALYKCNQTPEAIDLLRNVIIPTLPHFYKASYQLASLLQESSQMDMANAVFLDTVRNENSFESQKMKMGKTILFLDRPLNKTVIAIYCHEYGNTWWKNWGPSSLEKGVGGSEEAVIFLSAALVKLGFWVEVYGNPPPLEVGRHPSGVVWYPHTAYDTARPADMFVAWRYHISAALCNNTISQCYVWLHDLPRPGAFTPSFVESITGIFCLSDFHLRTLPYHAQSKGILASNGIDEKHLQDGPNNNYNFTYGSQPTRGLQTLLRLWPAIRQRLPEACLHVYYGFTDAVIAFAKVNLGKNYDVWKSEMDELLLQDGVHYHGLVDQHTLSVAYAHAGFYLYPTTFPEVSCISILKAQAMGAIPITSRILNSNLSEVQFDLGPRPLLTTPAEQDPEWLDLYVDAIVDAVENEKIESHRSEMKEYARRSYMWSNTAMMWQRAYQERAVLEE